MSNYNKLIVTCKNGQERFNQYAESMVESDLKTLLYQYSYQRSQFAGELQEQVRFLGGAPVNLDSVADSFRRGWLNFKTLLASQDRLSILAECESEEDATLHDYRAALKQELPENIARLVRQQTDKIQRAHDRFSFLREKAKVAKVAI